MIAVPLTRDGEPFLADDGSVTWSLRDHTGALMSGMTNVSLPSSDTTLLVEVPAAANEIAPGRQFEKRSISIKGLAEGQPFVAGAQYRITPWLNHSVTTSQIWAFIGTDAGELPEADIDITGAYFSLAEMVGETQLVEALSSGSKLEQRANDAIKGMAVLRVLPGVRQRLLKRAEDGTLKAERFAIDFNQLAADATALVTLAVREVGGLDDNVTAPTLFVLATPNFEPFPGG